MKRFICFLVMAAALTSQVAAFARTHAPKTTPEAIKVSTKPGVKGLVQGKSLPQPTQRTAPGAVKASTSVNVGFTGGKDPTSITNCLANNASQVVGFSPDTIFYGSPVESYIAVNPNNPLNLVVAWQQDRTYWYGAPEAGVAYSKDGGLTWNKPSKQPTTVPFEVCNGGPTQRLDNLWLDWSADGSTVYMVAITANVTPLPGSLYQSGVLLAMSTDGGVSWTQSPTKIPVQYLAQSQYALNTPYLPSYPPDSLGFWFDDKPSVTADPNNPDNVYVVWSRFPGIAAYHSDLEIVSSQDGGMTWSPPALAYDPYPDLTANNLSDGVFEDCAASGSIIVSLPQQNASKGVKNGPCGNLLWFFSRVYAKPGTPGAGTGGTAFPDYFPYQWTAADICLISSSDNGRTWSKFANQIVETDPNGIIYTGGYTYDNNGNITGGNGVVLRSNVSTNVATGPGQPPTQAGTFLVQLFDVDTDPNDGALFLAYQTNQFAANKQDQIGLVASYDGGNTWSNAAKVSRTPTTAVTGQAFCTAVAVTNNGYVGVLYSDFRNPNNLPTNPMTSTPTDVWLAVYKRTASQTGGSTHIGLDFVAELRLTPQSYILQNGPTGYAGYQVNGDYSALVAQGSKLYATWIQTLNPPTGGFTAPVNIAPTGSSQPLFLDNNLRTAPYVSVISTQ